MTLGEGLLAQGRTEGQVEGEVLGEAKGRALSLLDVFVAKGWSGSNEVRSHILACTDPEKLLRWLLRAVNATSLADAIADD